jgi:hypothetical protein
LSNKINLLITQTKHKTCFERATEVQYNNRKAENNKTKRPNASCNKTAKKPAKQCRKKLKKQRKQGTEERPAAGQQ